MNDAVALHTQDLEPARINWTASMVRPLADQGVGTPASFVARSFSLDRVGGGEVLHISALGLYRAFINGQRVGNDLLTPGWTCYDQRLSYQSYAVGHLLRAGEKFLRWFGSGPHGGYYHWDSTP